MLAEKTPTAVVAANDIASEILAVGDGGWEEALCRDGTAGMLALFFSEQLDDIARAKAICTECSLIEPCRQGALARSEPWGVWGGQLFANGEILPFKRKRGRPPKARPDQLTA